jgi:hypothetical protein
VIFSEPLDGRSVTDRSLRLLKNGNDVPGAVRVSDEGWEIDFTPDTPLDPYAAYTLVVDAGIRDLDGDAVDGMYSSTFTTGPECAPGQAVCQSSSTNTVNGSVVQVLSGSRTPMPDAFISGWVERVDGAIATIEQVSSDAQGRFRLTGLSNRRIHLLAVRPGYNQWCGVSAELTGNGATVDIELSPNGLSPSQLPARPPNLTGYVLELVPDPDRGGLPLLAIPVSGVRVTFDSPEGRTSMTAVTDAAGQFAMCNVPLGDSQLITASKLGYQAARYPLSTASASANRQLDVFITRSQSP